MDEMSFEWSEHEHHSHHSHNSGNSHHHHSHHTKKHKRKRIIIGVVIGIILILGLGGAFGAVLLKKKYLI